MADISDSGRSNCRQLGEGFSPRAELERRGWRRAETERERGGKQSTRGRRLNIGKELQ
ncbi:hypothetical protein N9L68_03250 [bacterium]|nr:hypothetical protein [bacterium]